MIHRHVMEPEARRWSTPSDPPPPWQGRRQRLNTPGRTKIPNVRWTRLKLTIREQEHTGSGTFRGVYSSSFIDIFWAPLMLIVEGWPAEEGAMCMVIE